MSKRNDEILIGDILEAISKIETYLEGYDFSKFMADEKTKDAVVRNLTVIGEASNRVSNETQSAHPEIGWSKIVRSRQLSSMNTLGLTMKLSGE